MQTINVVLDVLTIITLLGCSIVISLLADEESDSFLRIIVSWLILIVAISQTCFFDIGIF